MVDYRVPKLPAAGAEVPERVAFLEAIVGALSGICDDLYHYEALGHGQKLVGDHAVVCLEQAERAVRTLRRLVGEES